jgi:hypothetical protein
MRECQGVKQDKTTTKPTCSDQHQRSERSCTTMTKPQRSRTTQCLLMALADDRVRFGATSVVPGAVRGVTYDQEMLKGGGRV